MGYHDNALSGKSVSEAAAIYLGRRWNPVPIDYRSKEPSNGKGWQHIRVTAENVTTQFNGAPQNIGVQMGAASNGLTDVDMDSDVAIALAPSFMPTTGAVFGRPTAPSSHWLYTTDLAAKVDRASLAFDDPRKPKKEGRFLELRIGGGDKAAQTVFPPSVHKETGEAIAWVRDGDPAVVDGLALKGAASLLASCCLLACYWPATGSGCHDAALAVGGFLARTGLEAEDVRSAVDAIAAYANPERREELARTAAEAAQSHKDGQNAYGFPGLAKAFGEDLAKQVAEWLEYRGHTADTGASEDRWHDPDWSILEDRRGADLPEFPVELLSENVANWVRRAASGAAVTPAHVALPLLIIASGIIGTARRVQAASSWSEPLAMWGSVIGYSGTGKTPGIDTVKRPLSRIARELKKKSQDARLAHESKRAAAKAAREKWAEDLKKEMKKPVVDLSAVRDATKNPPTMPVEAMDPGEFVEPRLYTSDPTIERLAELINARPRGMLLVRDELSALFMNMMRYSGGTDNPFWLEAWNGGSHTVDRMSRHVSVDYLLVAICGGLQPDRVASSFEGDADGMYARVLFAWPAEPGYAPLHDDIAEDDAAIVAALTRLNELTEGAGFDGQFAPKAVPLSAGARAAFEEFRKQTHTDKHQLDGREREWWSKAQPHALRLAGTLAFLDWAFANGALEPQSISEEVMLVAIVLVKEFFWPHGRAALRQIGLSERHANKRKVMRWVRAAKSMEISLQDVRRGALAHALDEEETKELLRDLVKAGWLREVVKTGPGGPGRKRRRWEVNPTLWGDAEIAENAGIEVSG
jgi:hypothetical protein